MTKNDALMTRARRIDPVPASTFEGLARSPEGQETLNTILELPPEQPRKNHDVVGAKPQHRPLGLGAIARRTVVIGLAATVVIGIATVVAPQRPAPDGEMVWGAELVSIAESSPRYLIADEDWKITSVDEFSGQSGEMMFQNGPGALLANSTPGLYWVELSWNPASEHDKLVKDREHSAENSGGIVIADQRGFLFQDTDSAPIASTFYALWLDGEHSLQLRSDVIPTLEEFKAVTNHLRTVDVDAWLSAMPAGIVKPDERDEAIEKILAGLPVPANLDIDALKETEVVRNDYSLDYDVRSAVVCGWVQQWIDATKAGNSRSARNAAAAVAWSGWAEADNHGQWSSFVSDVAVAIKTSKPVNGERSLPIGVTYQRHLGCPEG